MKNGIYVDHEDDVAIRDDSGWFIFNENARNEKESWFHWVLAVGDHAAERMKWELVPEAR